MMLSVKFKNLHAVYPAILQLESEGGTYHMEALDTGSTWIYRQHVPFVIAHHLEDVRMSAHENIRTIPVYEFPGT